MTKDPMLAGPQLPLAVNLRDGADFDGFLTAGNGEAVAAARSLEPGVSYFWGERGSGRSHLLQAACGEASRAGLRSAYLPLASGAVSPEQLSGLEGMDLVALDDLDAVAGQTEWEHGLFHLYNRLDEERRRLLISAATSPGELPLELADLRSRCGWGLVFRLQRLDEAGLRRALVLRAGRRGLAFPDEVLDYLMRRLPRDPETLFTLLDRLDYASLAAKRRLTIPFIREQLDSLRP